MRVTVPGPAPAGNALIQKQGEIKNGIAGKALPSNLKIGENLRYEAVRDAIEALIPGLSYTVTAFTMTGVSPCDQRTQIVTSAGELVHVRSVEVAHVKPIDQKQTDPITKTVTDNVTVTVIGTTPAP